MTSSDQPTQTGEGEVTDETPIDDTQTLQDLVTNYSAGSKLSVKDGRDARARGTGVLQQAKEGKGKHHRTEVTRGDLRTMPGMATSYSGGSKLSGEDSIRARALGTGVLPLPKDGKGKAASSHEGNDECPTLVPGPTRADKARKGLDRDHMMTHRPKRKDCDVCQAAIKERYKYSSGGSTVHEAKKLW